MSEFQSILEKIIARQQARPMVVTVKSVDSTALTADCEPLDGGAPIQACRLRPVADSSGLGIVTLPKVGAFALLLQVSDAEACMVSCSEFDEIRIKSDALEVVAKSDGNVTVRADKVVVNASVVLGSEQGAEPMLKGDAVGDRVAEIYQHISAIHTALSAFASAGGAASVGPLSGYVPVYSALLGAITSELPATASDAAKFVLCKSQKTQTA